MTTENALSADNQQERLKLAWWIVGFVDGEGCFSISIFKNKTMSSGWQVMPEFVITQAESSLSSLVKVKKYFRCGHIFINKRYDNHTENLYRFCVRKREHLNDIIVPFFKTHPLLTAKKFSFEIFVKALKIINQGGHLKIDGLTQINKIVGRKNKFKNPQRLYAGA